MFDRTIVKIGEKQFEVLRSETELLVNGRKIEFPAVSLEKRLVTVRHSDRLERFVVNRNGDDLWLIRSGRVQPLVIETERDKLLQAAAHGAAGEHGLMTLRAAMPGLVVRVNVKIGQTVKRGEAVLILEAMKMENEVRAPGDGTVQEIKVNECDSVEKGAQLIVLTQ
ncbi:MAG: acetyl-CoA carboxylase biotin carboxyl carrier protein subunit [bacterium]|nr:acetyl-CoA carboxylase biotin carboxyl carrier protein subunit [bacterium]